MTARSTALVHQKVHRIHVPAVGLGEFTPGVARAKAAGHKIEVAPYPLGAAAVRLSLREVAKKIRDGRLDPDVRGWAGDVLIAAGKPASRRAKVQALLDAFRKLTVYVPDPVGAEYIVSAAGTVCLRPGLCVRARDCDDGVVLMGSAILSIGIPVDVVKQNFGPGKQEHVLVEFEDESGAMVPADPSTNLAVGERVRAVSEERIDPMEVVGSSGTAGAEIVTLGAVPLEGTSRHIWREGDGWHERRYGREFVYAAGVGWTPCACGVPLKEDGLGRGGGGHGGGGHGGGGRGGAFVRGGGGFRRHFRDGRWWDWGPSGWIVVEGESCGQWGDPIRSPTTDLARAAAAALVSSGGQPASATIGGTLYLFQKVGSGIEIRPCIQTGVSGVGATPAPTTAPPSSGGVYINGVAIVASATALALAGGVAWGMARRAR